LPSLQLVPKPTSGAIADSAERGLALDITRSWIVEAPAGSGKTGLLIQRFLKLLASPTVDEPSQILAITFTRKATSEMLDRVLGQLASAAAGGEPANPFDRATRGLAEDVLSRDRQLGWELRDHPTRLNIRTIDSISAEIANGLPVLSGSGGGLAPSEDGALFHAEAARRTLMLLGGDDPALTDALEILLLHRDGNLANCEDLIARMLGTRDQWGELVPLTLRELDDGYLDETVLPKLDRALDHAICRALTRLSHILPAPLLGRLCKLAAEMGELDGYKGTVSPIAICSGRWQSPAAKSAHLDHWRALVHLVVKPSKPRDWRKSASANHIGFEILKHHQADLKDIIARLSPVPGAFDALCHIDCLPPVEYPREQWQVMKALFRVLARALTELQIVFAERGQCDFAEVSLLARHALRTDGALDDLSVASGHRLQHLLVDEMQDTSTGQYEFIQLLTRRWDGHSQTVFLVGDPKQSIYLFRQARVERFVQTLLAERLGDLPLGVLRLTANFRSRPRLVQAFNDDFSQLFPAESDPEQPELVPYTLASAVREGLGQRLWHAAAVPTGEPAAGPAQRAQHAQEMRDLLLEWRVKPLPAGRAEPWKLAVLVRNRSHLGPIVAALRQTPPIPFRAVDIEPLGERPEILDLLALTRALLHPADRTAWLALLRGPWCGLALADLHRLAGQDDRTLAESTIYELMDTRGADLSEDGIERLQGFWQIIAAALAQRGRLSVSQWVANTWRAFGTPAYLDDAALANAERFFQLLDQLEEPGNVLSLTRLQEKVAELYAAPSVEPGAVDLMTLHGAKGLEWDVVLVPELHRAGRNNEGTLLSWIETDLADEEIAAGILAPIAGKGKATGQLNDWLRSIQAARAAAERKRLFYVACTRAREELHLFAAPARKQDGSISPIVASLLQAAWPAAEPFFAQATTVIQMPSARPTVLESLAASAAPRLIQRIPHLPSSSLSSSLLPLPSSFARPEGSFSARAFGNAMHAFLELLATRIAGGATSAALLAELPGWSPRINAVLRANGLAPADVDRFTSNILRGLTRTLNSPEGQWLLAPHAEAATESSLSSPTETIRLDRTFLAGASPLAPGADHLWIVDYKTSTHGPAGLDAFLNEEKNRYAPILENYARELSTQSEHPIRVALFYPLLPRLIWWEAPPAE
jgi:ATP-dependent helicase/nuclease subunit A